MSRFIPLILENERNKRYAIKEKLAFFLLLKSVQFKTKMMILFTIKKYKNKDNFDRKCKGKNGHCKKIIKINKSF